MTTVFEALPPELQTRWTGAAAGWRTMQRAIGAVLVLAGLGLAGFVARYAMTRTASGGSFRSDELIGIAVGGALALGGVATLVLGARPSVDILRRRAHVVWVYVDVPRKVLCIGMDDGALARIGYPEAQPTEAYSPDERRAHDALLARLAAAFPRAEMGYTPQRRATFATDPKKLGR